ncbi:hypothetical protein BpHYR1_050155 [Brachionus plicatilis]|uniref:Uncharacterized protein n=1 Tax=Brachionus plicatilis TaxID=10195 RepID=A0A3M7Q586_BRAPC|nr:hypothetical protein BpHYR1_050155 [Brachionus plicatilis]
MKKKILVVLVEKLHHSYNSNYEKAIEINQLIFMYLLLDKLLLMELISTENHSKLLKSHIYNLFLKNYGCRWVDSSMHMKWRNSVYFCDKKLTVRQNESFFVEVKTPMGFDYY